MTIEQVLQLPGANMLQLRVADVLTQCGLPAAIDDHAGASADKKSLRWAQTEMRLSDGDWDLSYHNASSQRISENVPGWVNPNISTTDCFPGVSDVRLFTKAGVGVLKIDRRLHTTTYSPAATPYQGHKVKGYRAVFALPMAATKITSRYGGQYETLAAENNGRLIRYWVLVESGQMPIALYAVDFKFDMNDVCEFYQVSGSDYGFVEKKFVEFNRVWERYGID